MRIRWSLNALSDIERLYQFLADVDPLAAGRARSALRDAPQRLLGMPRMGPRLEKFTVGEVRRIQVGKYDMRYEIYEGDVMILRIFHQSDDRAR